MSNLPRVSLAAQISVVGQFSTKAQLDWVDRAINRIPLASKALRSAEMDMEEQVGLSLLNRLQRALEREEKAKQQERGE